MKNLYKALIYNNVLHFYDYKLKKIIKIRFTKNAIKDNKIIDLKQFIKEIKNNNLVKRISGKIVSEKIQIITWPNYTNVDKGALYEAFSELNFGFIDYTSIDSLLKMCLPNIIVCCDGIYYIYEVMSYFDYASHHNNILDLIDFIKSKYSVNNYILIQNEDIVNIIDSNAYLYENNDNYFDEMLENMD